MFLVHQVSSTFYASIPWGDGFYWVFFVIATAAACVASQAMISGAFSIIRQSMSLDCFPKLTVIHKSKLVSFLSVYGLKGGDERLTKDGRGGVLPLHKYRL